MYSGLPEQELVAALETSGDKAAAALTPSLVPMGQQCSQAGRSSEGGRNRKGDVERGQEEIGTGQDRCLLLPNNEI